VPLLPELATEATWLKLGHYEPSGHTPTGWVSTIHGGDFFVDPHGSTDPLSELQATVRALNDPPGGDPDQHAQCRFPARLLWLKRRLGDQAAFRADITCPAFIAWTKSASVSSISVVFASGFLGNPASYYGHTLLKFNFQGGDRRTTLMDVSVNYGAILEGKHDGQIAYLVKSLVGGYDAGFSHIHFYYHDHNYGNHELRDLWEYRLDLSPEDVDLVVAHAWEVLGKRYTYYFFRGNCADRMAELLEVVDGVDIVPRNRPWIVPQALMQSLFAARYQGRPLVADVIYHPSRQSRFYEKFLSLAQGDADLLADLVARKSSFESPQFQSQTTSAKQAILDALLDYYQFVDNPVAEATTQAKQDYADALSVRYQLPPGVPQVRPRVPDSPDRARPAGWVQVGVGHNTITGDLLSLRVRPAYYDALDFDSGHVRYGSLAMADTQIDILRGRIRINRFDAIHVESVNPGISGLAGDRGAAWRLGVGAAQARLWCEDCLVARAEADVGYGHQWNSAVFSAAYLGGALQNDRAGQGFGFGRASAVLIASLGESIRAKLGYEFRIPEGGQQAAYGVTQAEVRWAPSSRMDLRARYDHDAASQLSVGIGFYW